MRVRICLEEAKESGYWLQLLDLCQKGPSLEAKPIHFTQKGDELVRIFSTIIQKCKPV
jgi:hypothetical protein